MIASFADKRTAALFLYGEAKGVTPPLAKAALLKLRLLHAAQELRDLQIPPGNRLEALRGNRKGQHSIRVNNQWRLCFVWKSGQAHEVEFVDYH